MRIVEPTLRMFISKIEEVDQLRAEIAQYADLWFSRKKEFGPSDGYTRDARSSLEGALIAYKQLVSEIYDMMHDRGLTNFESGWIERTPYHPLKLVEVDELDAVDCFVPGINQYVRSEFEDFVTRRDHSHYERAQNTQDTGQKDAVDLQSTGSTVSSDSSKSEEVEGKTAKDNTSVDVYEEFVSWQ